MKKIRNFCIIAHIDHGKSTLADRLLELTKTLSIREMTNNQILDNNPLEQERGITIKLHAIQMEYNYKIISNGIQDDGNYILNLIDTPGHVDFSYEVSRSLAACEGALLIVDATQGIEAQTISNLYLAIEHNLEIIPIINKIDLPSAATTIENVKKQIVDLLGCDKKEILQISAKTGIGVEEVLDAIVERIPHPKGNINNSLSALIYDSIYDSYRGVIVNVRIFDGSIKAGDTIKFLQTDNNYEVEEVGIMQIKRVPTAQLSAGQVGYFIANIKNLQDTKVGDTVTHLKNPCVEPIAGFKLVKPMVFSGIYPTSTDDFENLREALGKLVLNDSAVTYEPETSSALGFGFRCGFLGLLHMEIVQERLEREFQQSIVTTVPSVQYKVIKTNGDVIYIENPAQLPPPVEIDEIHEPILKAETITPSEYIGNIMKLCIEKRGIAINTVYLSENRVDLYWELPLSEIVFDFYDKLKSITRGYASLDYEFKEYRESDLVKLDILLNGDPVDALSAIVHRGKSYEWGKKLCSKLKELIPQQMFEVAIQAAIGSKVIARTTVKALRKNVLAKCCGGDISRKRKLLEKQKEGKKRMKHVGNIEIPQEAFLAVLSIDK
jgi:GTP-binding protein LepA